MRLLSQDDDTALLEQALAMSMAEAAQAAAAAGGGPAAADISMAESGGDDQDLAYGRALEGSTDIVVSTFLLVFLHSRLLFYFLEIHDHCRTSVLKHLKSLHISMQLCRCQCRRQRPQHLLHRAVLM